MKVIIAGGRDFKDVDLMYSELDQFFYDPNGNHGGVAMDVEIVSGHARGADQMGEMYAAERGYQLKIFPANWDKYGKAAGHIRNKEMGEYADRAVVFWNGKSRGSQDMILLMKSYNKPVNVIRYE